MEDSKDAKEEPAFTVEELQEQCEEANRVLGFGDPDKCTYDLGYVPRQAVFSCLTCAGDQPAGLCTACALTCHDSHELVEVWTRRSFRCDCGNSRLPAQQCRLQPAKDATNPSNVYNQNFKGEYCTCHRPYPDPERQAKDEDETMLQCVVCEDWFHEEHLGGQDLGETEDEVEYDEVICPGCFESKCKFLALYPSIFLAESKEAGAAASTGESPAATGRSSESLADQSSPACLHQEAGGGSAKKALGCKLADAAQGRELAEVVLGLTLKDLLSAGELLAAACTPEHPSQESLAAPSSAPSEGTIFPSPCSAAGRPEEAVSAAESAPVPGLLESHSPASVAASDGKAASLGILDNSASQGAPSSQGAPASCPSDATEVKGVPPLFLSRGWRSSLCTCSKCTRYYELQGVAFLTRDNDTIRAYEEASTQKRKEVEAAATSELNKSLEKIGPVGQMELLYAKEDLKASLTQYLKKFEGTDHVVTAADVEDFFQDFRKKRPRLS